MNLQMGSRAYVEVLRTDALYQRDRERLKQLAQRDVDGQWFLRLVGDDQRCIALEGTIDDHAACGIYAVRPKACRRVQPGDDECVRARTRFGLPL